MTEAAPRLIVERGQSTTRVFTITSDTTTIGRSPENDLVLTDPEISRRHTRILRQETAVGMRYAVEDLGSTNGTFLNRQRLSSLTPLRHDDLIELGDAFALRFEYQPETAVVPDEPEDPYLSPDDYDTPPIPFPAYTPSEPEPEPVPPEQLPEANPRRAAPPPPPPAAPAPTSRRRLFLGCGCAFLVFIFLCIGTFFILDAYDQGRLLYCGSLRPLFELILGPFGFNPAC